MTIADLTPAHVDRLVGLFRRLPESDLTFIKEEVHDPVTVAGWVDQRGRRWVHLADGSTDGADEVDGFAALLPLSGWSDHVAELRVVVDPAARGHGIGRDLARHAVSSALHSGLQKVIVELPADQERSLDMFAGLGFTGEALLRDHFRDRTGQLRDLVMLAHFADATFNAMDAVGLADAIEMEGD